MLSSAQPSQPSCMGVYASAGQRDQNSCVRGRVKHDGVSVGALNSTSLANFRPDNYRELVTGPAGHHILRLLDHVTEFSIMVIVRTVLPAPARGTDQRWGVRAVVTQGSYRAGF